jgi:PAS domain S-box-containing protein
MVLQPDSAIRSPPRIKALQETGLLGTPPEEPFDRLTRLATEILDAPISLITLVSGERQFFKSSIGLPEGWAPERETPLSHSLAKHVVAGGEPVVVTDAREDPRLQQNPAVAELNVRAYAGVPLRTPDDHVLGALSVIDHTRRDWTPREIALLEDLAELARWAINQRVTSRRSAQSREQIEAPAQLQRLFDHSLAGVYLVREGRFLYVNPRLAEIFGYTQEEIISDKWPCDLAVEQDRERVEENVRRRLEGEAESVHFAFRGLRKDGETVEVEVLGSQTEIGGTPAVMGTLLDVTNRRRAEEALRRREEHFRLLLENAWDIIYEVRANGTIRYISPSVERILGYRPQELVGRPTLEFVHPQDRHEVEHTFLDDIRTPGVARSLPMRLRHADGSWRHMDVRVRIAQDGTDSPVAIVNAHDVTDERRVEAALRRSEERYRLVARAASNAIRDWEVASGRCVWSGATIELLRFSEGELGSTIEWWCERIHPEDREQVVSGIHAVLDGMGESWSGEYRFLRGDDAYVTVLDHCFITRDERSIPVRVIGSLLDVTERKRAEVAQRFLARASALLNEDLSLEVTLGSLARLAVPTLADYCLIDLVEKGKLRRMAVAHVDPLKEANLHKNEHHTLDGDAERHPVIQVVRSGQSVLVTECTEAVLEMISHDEEHHSKLREMGLCSYMIVPLLAHGNVVGVITLAAAESGRHYGPRDLLLATDLAHRGALAIEHAQLYEEAQEAIRARDDVLGVVSHDLRNPLNTIQLSATLLLDTADERRSGNVRALEMICRAAGQMNRMIEDLLDASSIEAGRFFVQRARYDACALIEEARELLEPLTREKSLRIECEVAENVGAVSIDFQQILRVFSNLVGNAIKFTPENGTIRLRAELFEEEVRFSVMDSGPGIPAEQLAHIFDRYWQAHRGDRRGVGLGLAIAKGIVEAHSGRIWAQSSEGSGAAFHFSIPVALPGSAPSE